MRCELLKAEQRRREALRERAAVYRHELDFRAELFVDGAIEDGVAQSLERRDVGEVETHFCRAACPVVDGGYD